MTLTMGRLVRHRQTKVAATDMLALRNAKPVLYSTDLFLRIQKFSGFDAGLLEDGTGVGQGQTTTFMR